MKRIICFILLMLVFASSSVSVLADSAERIIDGADLLTSEEEEKLADILDEISIRQEYDVVVMTVESMSHEDYSYYAAHYAERMFYDYGYGYGEDKQGVIFLISMEYRDWGIYSTDMSDSTVEAIGNDAAYYLSDGDYYGAFVAFAESIDEELISASTFPLLRNIAIAVVVGLVIALIVVSVMKGKLKTVRSRNHAREYVREGSFDLQHSRDLYLYSTVTRVPRPKNTSGGSRGGGGGGRASGKF